MTILLNNEKLIFIKGSKVAGSSFELALSKFSQKNDIVTPLNQLETGQVCIFVRTVPKEVDASGGRTKTLQNDNPFEYEAVSYTHLTLPTNGTV